MSRKDGREWAVEDRCQWVGLNGDALVISEGTVTELVMGSREKRGSYSYDPWNRNAKRAPEMEQYVEQVKVKWDDGEEETVSYYDVQDVDSELERTFRLAVNEAQDRIYAKLAEAEKLLDEAVAISEETGIPFGAGISPLSQSYIPNSMSDKFPDVDRSFCTEVADAYGEYEGWQHSAVC